jgi:hypothetical protein
MPFLAFEKRGVTISLATAMVELSRLIKILCFKKEVSMPGYVWKLISLKLF